MTDLPAIEPAYFDDALASKLTGNNETMPRILILYGSVHESGPTVVLQRKRPGGCWQRWGLR